MAVITGGQLTRLYNDGQAAVAVLYALRDVTTGDTADLGPEGNGDFLAVKQAVLVGATIGDSAVAEVSGTVVTMPDGLDADAVYLLAWGAADY